ncbi:hypothetical protein WA158_000992 [Blastocystis sp. Blastoise]
MDERSNLFVVKRIYNFFSASSSGCVTAIILQPFDVIKTRQQGGFKATLIAKDVTQRELHRISSREAFKQVYKERGIRGLWDGTTASLVRSSIGIGLYFTLLNIILGNETEGKHNKHSSLTSLCAGFCARSLVSVALLPVTVTKTRMEWSNYKYKGFCDALMTTARQEGIKGLYSGLWATVLRDAPASGLYLMAYHYIKPKVHSFSDNICTIPISLIPLTAGIISGAFASTVTHPFDVIKTRHQLQNSINKTYKSIWQTSYEIFKEDGIRGIFNGSFMRISKKAMSSALTWTLYEATQRFAELKQKYI